MILAEIFDQDRWMRIAYSKVKGSDFYNPLIFNKVDKFLDDYVQLHGLSVSDVIHFYNHFTSQYSHHIRSFLIDGKYPYQNGLIPNLPRIDYDIVLILSVVLSTHRHRIFQNLIRTSESLEGNVALIGVGSGLELEFINPGEGTITAFDISISDHIKEKYEHVVFHEGYFTDSVVDCCNIFAIELLEHLPNPLEFSDMIYNSLQKNGSFFFTTAKNVPQIDHLYNFSNKESFNDDLTKIGFKIIEDVVIEHESIDSKLHANNVWYHLIK